jgi:hypothetical protein
MYEMTTEKAGNTEVSTTKTGRGGYGNAHIRYDINDGLATEFSPPEQGPWFAHILQLWPVMACYGLGMRQPAHGGNVRAKRLTH